MLHIQPSIRLVLFGNPINPDWNPSCESLYSLFRYLQSIAFENVQYQEMVVKTLKTKLQKNQSLLTECSITQKQITMLQSQLLNIQNIMDEEKQAIQRKIQSLQEKLQELKEKRHRVLQALKANHQALFDDCCFDLSNVLYIRLLTEMTDVRIEYAKNSKAKALKLCRLFGNILNTPELELTYLATLFFSLCREWKACGVAQSASREDYEMLGKILHALENIVLPKDSWLQTPYYLFSRLQSSKSKSKGISRKDRFIQISVKTFAQLAQKGKIITQDELSFLTRIVELDSRSVRRRAPTCYELTLRNYQGCHARTLYYIAQLYHKIDCAEVVISDPIDLNVGHCKLYTEEGKRRHNIPDKTLGLYKEHWHDRRQSFAKHRLSLQHRVSSLSVKDLFTLVKVFSCQDELSKVGFSSFERLIRALGGCVALFSRTNIRVYLPECQFNLPKLVGMTSISRRNPKVQHRIPPLLHELHCKRIKQILTCFQIKKSFVLDLYKKKSRSTPCLTGLAERIEAHRMRPSP